LHLMAILQRNQHQYAYFNSVKNVILYLNKLYVF